MRQYLVLAFTGATARFMKRRKKRGWALRVKEESDLVFSFSDLRRILPGKGTCFGGDASSITYLLFLCDGEIYGGEFSKVRGQSFVFWFSETT